MPCSTVTRLVAALACAVSMLAGVAATHAQDAFRQGLDAYLNGEYQAALQHWRPAAESGDAVAAFNIGVLYAQGLGVETDHAGAVRWYRRSAHEGYANAQFNLGSAYYNGEGTEVNIAQAASWWERAADQDHPEAAYNLATLYRRGNGVPQDTRRAAELYNKAATLGDPRARQALADMGSPDPETGNGDAAGAEQAAADGAPRAGGVVSDGTAGTDTDTQQAAAGPGGDNRLTDENPDHWTVQVFAGTEAQAARQFARDHGLSGNLRIYQAEIDGKTWFKGIYGSFPDRAAAQAAQAELSRELSGSDPWVRSYRAIQAEAVGETLVSTAAPEPGAGDSEQPREQSVTAPDDAGAGDADEAPGDDDTGPGAEPAGDSPAAESPSSGSPGSGDRAALGEGKRAFNAQDYEAAMAAWRPLAEKGVAEAQYGVGFMYESGWGVDQDLGEAFRWYQQAAQQGHIKAQYNLGMLYRNGQGVSQNDALGLYWIQTAADRGDERAANYLKDMN